MSVLFEKQFAVSGAGNIGRILLERLRLPAQPVVSYAAAVPISLLA